MFFLCSSHSNLTAVGEQVFRENERQKERERDGRMGNLKHFWPRASAADFLLDTSPQGRETKHAFENLCTSCANSFTLRRGWTAELSWGPFTAKHQLPFGNELAQIAIYV